MSNGFQFYEGTKTDSATTPKITVRKGGVLILTKAALDKLGEDVTHVQVGYNEKTRAIGIRRAGVWGVTSDRPEAAADPPGALRSPDLPQAPPGPVHDVLTPGDVSTKGQGPRLLGGIPDPVAALPSETVVRVFG